MEKDYDFAGYVTKNDVLCTDGVTIRHGAFLGNDGQVVPLIYNHDKHNPDSYLGHVILEHRDDSVYGYGYFNDSPRAELVKQLVNRGEINSMSIGADKVKRSPTNDVVSGNITEVSLVRVPANSGAKITEVLNHNDDNEESIIMYTGQNINANLEHSAKEDDYVFQDGDLLNTLAHAATEEEADEMLVNVLSTLSPEQQEAVAMLSEIVAERTQEEVLAAVEQAEADDDTVNKGGMPPEDGQLEQSAHKGNYMKNNVFASAGADQLSHAAEIRSVYNEAINTAKDQGRRLSDVLNTSDYSDIKDTLQHSLTNPELLFPDYKNTQGVQAIYSPNTATEHILSSVTKAPTAFVKSLLTDLSDLDDEDLRARGYIKGNEKKEQIVKFLTRKTDPKTIYKKQSIDRDDMIDMSAVIDIATFYYQEMRVKLNDEIARAILVGDGRAVGSRDKINEENIRPIKSDEDFYTIKKEYDDTDLIELFKTVAIEKTQMLGSGTPTLYVNSRFITSLRFLRNKDGNWVFGGQQPATHEYLASLFGVKAIVECDFLKEGEMIMTNLADYQIGSDKGGPVTSFEHFDIDYNKHKYLVETRISGALIRPKAAVYFSVKAKTGGGSTTNP